MRGSEQLDFLVFLFDLLDKSDVFKCEQHSHPCQKEAAHPWIVGHAEEHPGGKPSTGGCEAEEERKVQQH